MPRTHRITAAAVLACAGIAAASAAGTATERHWGRQYPATERFQVLTQFGGVAVLDRETHLVWERAPSPALLTWSSAFAACLPKATGGRKGWRLPTADELTSLQDASVLPPGHPFDGVKQEAFWTATSHPEIASAYLVFGSGGFGFHPKSASHRAWCVRGAQS
jgi:Protein of unknown function (DUF1566)